jgi:predicted TIM-barrel fold metal-dependent hydrolase
MEADPWRKGPFPALNEMEGQHVPTGIAPVVDAHVHVCALCETKGMPLVVHAGQEPKSPAYHCDPYLLCGAVKTERLLKRYPDLKMCVPHLGMGEFEAYRRLIERYDTLWLDTSMAITDFFPLDEEIRLQEMRTDRIMYGTDFPNIPYAWDRELKKLMQYPLGPEARANILGGNAKALFDLNLA